MHRTHKTNKQMWHSVFKTQSLDDQNIMIVDVKCMTCVEVRF